MLIFVAINVVRANFRFEYPDQWQGTSSRSAALRRLPPREIRDALMRRELDHLREMGILDHERRHHLLGHEIQLGVGMAPVQRAHEGSGEEDVADGAEPDAHNTQHAANVVARCPASPAGLACHARCRVRRVFSGLTTKSMAWPRTASFSSSRDLR